MKKRCTGCQLHPLSAVFVDWRKFGNPQKNWHIFETGGRSYFTPIGERFIAYTSDSTATWATKNPIGPLLFQGVGEGQLPPPPKKFLRSEKTAENKSCMGSLGEKDIKQVLSTI